MRPNLFVILTDKYSHRHLHREVTEVRAMYCHDCSKTLVSSGHEPSSCLISSTNKIHAKYHNVTHNHKTSSYVAVINCHMQARDEICQYLLIFWALVVVEES